MEKPVEYDVYMSVNSLGGVSIGINTQYGDARGTIMGGLKAVQDAPAVALVMDTAREAASKLTGAKRISMRIDYTFTAGETDAIPGKP